MKIINNRFITKILTAYLCILLLGVGVASVMLSNVLIGEIIRIQSRYEEEILNKIQVETDNQIKDIQKIYENLYLKNTIKNQSIIDLLMFENITPDTESVIKQFLKYAVMTNTYLSDILLVDYKNEKIYMESKSTNRRVTSSGNFFQGDFFSQVKQGANEIIISDIYQPDYLSDQSDIITIYLNLLDSNNLQNGQKYGAILVNISPKIFFSAYKNYKKDSIGQIIVTNGQKVYFNTDQTNQEKQFLEEEWRNNKHLIINKQSSNVSDLTYYSIVDTKILYKNVYDKLLGSIIGITAICLVVGIAVSTLIAYFFGKRIDKISKHMELIQKGNLDERIEVSSKDELGELEENLNKTSKKLKEYIETIYIKDLKVKKTELKFLQMQINPHFMFNTLEVIRADAVTNGNITTARMITLLGNLFRWNLRNKDIVTLESEMDYLESYIELQELRKGNHLECHLNIPYELRNYVIPKLTLQPLIENAINHGYTNEMNNFTVQVEAIEQIDTFIIIVQDNGKGMEREELQNILHKLSSNSSDEDLYHIGLRNIQQRIRMIMGEDCSIKIESCLGEGTKIWMQLPKYREGELDHV